MVLCSNQFTDHCAAHIFGESSNEVEPYTSSTDSWLWVASVGRNPFEGYIPEVPEGAKLDYGGAQCNELEDIGMHGSHMCVLY